MEMAEMMERLLAKMNAMQEERKADRVRRMLRRMEQK
jgi:hypothetical protein